jgi:hypothetical protein
MKGLGELLGMARLSEPVPTPDTSSLPTFTPFPHLPTELRTAIWRAALPCDLHITEVLIYNKSIAPHLFTHAIFSVNRESRAEAFRVLLNAPPPYSLPADPQQDIISLSPRIWNDLPHVSMGKAPIRATVSDIDRAHRFVAATMVDSEGARFENLPVDVRFYSPHGYAAISAGPLDFQRRPLRTDFRFFLCCEEGREGEERVGRGVLRE